MSQRPLIDALLDPQRNARLFAHPVHQVRLLETHISYVLLTGEYAYKLKKEVDLGFVDFSTLEKRRAACLDELRLNRRWAPQLYLDVVELGGGDLPLEYAVKMREFPQAALLDRRAVVASPTNDELDRLTSTIATVHALAARAPLDSDWGSPARVANAMRENFSQIEMRWDARDQRGQFESVRSWTESLLSLYTARLETRRRDGFVREVHGDLHLGNIAYVDGVLTPFDGLEFSPTLRWIDVASDLSFLLMDFHFHRLPGAAARVLDRYLQATADWEALRVLPLYLVYRAMVRAKVAKIRAAQDRIDDAQRAHEIAACNDHLALAYRLTLPRTRALIVMHGLSGSGKSTVANALVEALGAVSAHSDVERKRLFGLRPEARTGSGVAEGVYGPEASARTYAELLRIARLALQSSWPVVLDATYLRRSFRAPLLDVAAQLGVPLRIVACRTDDEALAVRLDLRARRALDPSEATADVLAVQRREIEPPSSCELDRTIDADTAHESVEAIAQRVASSLDAAWRSPG